MVLNDKQIEELSTILTKSLDELYIKDKALIDIGVNERNIAFRLGLYIISLLQNNEDFKNLNVDVDYNKIGERPKRTPRRPNGAVPDLIVHKRGNNHFNILVVEIKGWWNTQSRQNDLIKLEDFTHQEGEYKYGIGSFVELDKENYTFETYKGY